MPETALGSGSVSQQVPETALGSGSDMSPEIGKKRRRGKSNPLILDQAEDADGSGEDDEDEDDDSGTDVSNLFANEGSQELSQVFLVILNLRFLILRRFV